MYIINDVADSMIFVDESLVPLLDALRDRIPTVRKIVVLHLSSKFSKWWLPDEIHFIDEVPKTSVGKFDKKVLRQRATAPAR